MSDRGKGRKGLGKGGAKRHRKILRDIQGITKPAIRRQHTGSETRAFFLWHRTPLAVPWQHQNATVWCLAPYAVPKLEILTPKRYDEHPLAYFASYKRPLRTKTFGRLFKECLPGITVNCENLTNSTVCLSCTAVHRGAGAIISGTFQHYFLSCNAVLSSFQSFQRPKQSISG